jgi:hypothetical protein
LSPAPLHLFPSLLPSFIYLFIAAPAPYASSVFLLSSPLSFHSPARLLLSLPVRSYKSGGRCSPRRVSRARNHRKTLAPLHTQTQSATEIGSPATSSFLPQVRPRLLCIHDCLRLHTVGWLLRWLDAAPRAGPCRPSSPIRASPGRPGSPRCQIRA